MNGISPELHGLLHTLWGKAVGQDGYVKGQWLDLDALLHDRDALPDHDPPFAILYSNWDELEVLAALVDGALAFDTEQRSKHWTMLNSLRTQLREAQATLRR